MEMPTLVFHAQAKKNLGCMLYDLAFGGDLKLCSRPKS